jgi:hypothetical protein
MNPEQEQMHNWASKLEQLPTPDPAGSWVDMRLRLDREMPVTDKKDTRRWAILTLLLLIVLGVCNCPGLMQNNSESKLAKHSAAKNERESPSRTGLSLKKKNDSGLTSAQEKLARTPQKGQITIQPSIQQPIRRKEEGTQSESLKQSPNLAISPTNRQKPQVRQNRDKQYRPFSAKAQEQTPGPNPITQSNPETQATVNPAPQNKFQETETKGIKQLRKDSLDKIVSKPKTAHRPLSDSSTKSSGKANVEEDYGKGWEVGLGLNQFFPVGQQQSSNYNSSGLTGGLSDYIPVPVIRHYFDRKSYVQAEAEINCPQYTRNLLASQVGANTSGSSGDQNSTYIQKLFYFNLPVSIYYSPVRHLYLGAGLQFSALTNGVALFQDKEISVGGPDSVKFTKHQSLKSTPVYKDLTTTEWRFLFDLNYHWKPLTIGVRYNQALSKFINVRISNTQVTQARNSSLQIYLRYVLWKNRKKIIVPPK